MLKNVNTSMGSLTVTTLKMRQCAQWNELFVELPKKADGGIDGFSPALMPVLQKFVPLILAALQSVHQDMTLEALESGLTLFDFNVLYDAVEYVSGLRRVCEQELLEGQEGEKPCQII